MVAYAHCSVFNCFDKDLNGKTLAAFFRLSLASFERASCKVNSHESIQMETSECRRHMFMLRMI